MTRLGTLLMERALKQGVAFRETSVIHSGKPFFMENFELLPLHLGWEQSIGGTGEFVQSNITAFQGKFSGKLTSPNVENGYAECWKAVGWLYRHRIGMEIWFAHDANRDNLQNGPRLGLSRLSGTEEIWGMLRYSPADGHVWQYYASDGTWKTLCMRVMRAYVETSLYCWHYAKLVVNFDADRYAYAVVDDLVFNLANYRLRHDALVADPCDTFHVFVDDRATPAQASIYIDNMVLTYDEGGVGGIP